MKNIPISERAKLLKALLSKKILVLDGAMGTSLQNLNLTDDDFGGAAYEGCNENLVLTKPEVILKVHEDFLIAGCDIVETDTFGATPLVLDEFSLKDKAIEINIQAAKLARQAAEKHSTDNKPRFVAGSIGPTTKAISVTGGITFNELVENFYIQALGLMEGGVDYLLLETAQDSRNLKAALVGFHKLFRERKMALPVAISGTIEPMGTMLAGQSIEALAASFAHEDLLYMGLNCATGPEFMTDHIRSLSEMARVPVSCVPNAGLPDEEGEYLDTPQMMSSIVSRFVENGWVNVLGGCCGTTPDHITALSNLAKNAAPRSSHPINVSCLTGIDYLEVTEDNRPIIVGERTNVIGSRKFKRLICEEKFDEASDIARAQVKSGAQVIDVCLANPDREELEDVEKFLTEVIKKIRVPIMIDSTDENVIAKALTYCQGKSIINSINLEDGEERFEKIIPLVKEFGAAVVVGTIDDDPKQGMAINRERKLQVAERSYELLTKKYGIDPRDIYWDPLVFPCATGDKQYIGSAEETIEGLRLIKQKYPETKTVLGVSNVSFGLPAAGREVLNSVFLYHCVQAGLDMALVNSEKLERYASIPEDEKLLADNLLLNRGDDPIAAFANHFRERKVEKKIKENRTLNERLSDYILEGSKDGLAADLDLALKEMAPLDIVNGPLMDGMDEVGKLFNANKLIVAEVLQSAEAMKAAVSHLEPHMEASETSIRGTMVLATVKGDVHDIGKNLVEIILSNNGFKVINLGIKVPPADLIAAVRKYKPDLIGLSGLLVKSAQQMVITVDDFSKAGINVPVLVGGAALTSKFTDRKIAPKYIGTVAYASDAMNGLDLSKRIVNPEDFEVFKNELAEKRQDSLEETQPGIATDESDKNDNSRSADVSIIESPPKPTDYKRHVLKDTPIDQIWSFINPMMLYTRHLGLKAGIVKALEASVHDDKKLAKIKADEPRSYDIWRLVQDVKNQYRDTDLMRPIGIYQFFKASSEGNKINIFANPSDSDAKVVFEFQRQTKGKRYCLADYIRAKGGAEDNLALFIVSVGKGVRETADELKERGEYLKSYVLQTLALESAEGYAELLHSELRKNWGTPDPQTMTMMERFQAKYSGKRYSFGYPACPDLEKQAGLFELLNPTGLGVELTDGFMMDPEASVSAIVFHHPDAKYYAV